MDDTQLEQQLKQLIIRECDKEDDIDWQSIDNNEPLFGEGRQVLTTIANIAAFIRQHA